MKGQKKMNEEVSKTQTREKGRQRVKKRNKRDKDKRIQNKEKNYGKLNLQPCVCLWINNNHFSIQDT